MNLLYMSVNKEDYPELWNLLHNNFKYVATNETSGRTFAYTHAPLPAKSKYRNFYAAEGTASLEITHHNLSLGLGGIYQLLWQNKKHKVATAEELRTTMQNLKFMFEEPTPAPDSTNLPGVGTLVIGLRGTKKYLVAVTSHEGAAINTTQGTFHAWELIDIANVNLTGVQI